MDTARFDTGGAGPCALADARAWPEDGAVDLHPTVVPEVWVLPPEGVGSDAVVVEGFELQDEAGRFANATVAPGEAEGAVVVRIAPVAPLDGGRRWTAAVRWRLDMGDEASCGSLRQQTQFTTAAPPAVGRAGQPATWLLPGDGSVGSHAAFLGRALDRFGGGRALPIAVDGAADVAVRVGTVAREVGWPVWGCDPVDLLTGRSDGGRWSASAAVLDLDDAETPLRLRDVTVSGDDAPSGETVGLSVAGVLDLSGRGEPDRAAACALAFTWGLRCEACADDLLAPPACVRFDARGLHGAALPALPEAAGCG